MSAQSAALRTISILSGEFSHAQEEERYIASRWDALARQFQITMALGCFILGLTLIVDHLAANKNHLVTTVTTAKFVVLALASFAIALAGDRKRASFVYLVTLVIAGVLTFANVAQVMSGITAWSTLSMITMIQLLFFSLLMASPMLVRALACGSILSSFPLALNFATVPAEAPETIVIQFSFCLLCFECARRINRSMRQEYLPLIEEPHEAKAASEPAAKPAVSINELNDSPTPAEPKENKPAHQTEQSKIESQALTDVLFDAVESGLAHFDKNFRLNRWNPLFEELLDLPANFASNELTLECFLSYIARNGYFGNGLHDTLVDTRIKACRGLCEDASYLAEEISLNGLHLDLHYHGADDGSLLLVVCDVTADIALTQDRAS